MGPVAATDPAFTPDGATSTNASPSLDSHISSAHTTPHSGERQECPATVSYDLPGGACNEVLEPQPQLEH